MGRSDPAPSRPGRGPGFPAGWIVAGTLAIALAAFLAFQAGRRSSPVRGAVVAVPVVVQVSPGAPAAQLPHPAAAEFEQPAPTPKLTPTPSLQSALMEVTLPARPGALEAQRAAGLLTTPPARLQPGAEFLIVWARQRLTPCCKEVWGSVKNVGNASGYCEVRLVGIQNTLGRMPLGERDVLTKTVHAEPYSVYPGDTANFKATFYDFHWAEEWRVEVDNLKADEFGNRWVRTAFLRVTPLPLGELE